MFTADQAAAISIALKWGYLSRDEINDLALAEIEKFNGTPPATICELAICKHDFKMLEILSELGGESEKLTSLIHFLRNYVQSDDLTNSGISSLARYIGHYVDWDDAEPWRQLKVLDHEISDARIGVIGDYDTFCEEYKKIISTI